jgi:hypothetical protein
MADPPELLVSMALARLTLITNLIRLLLRERAFVNGQTKKDILEWSEETKRSFQEEGKLDPFLEAAIDEFFNLLASEVGGDRGSF